MSRPGHQPDYIYSSAVLAGEDFKLGSRNRSFEHSRPAFPDHRAREAS